MHKNCLSVLAWHVVNKFQEGGGGRGGAVVVMGEGVLGEERSLGAKGM